MSYYLFILFNNSLLEIFISPEWKSGSKQTRKKRT